ncbi:hypothetical protein CYK37_08125 [Mesorhizobium loti]|nr:hypothetical protein [Mesorhizobium loti]PLP60120.1 hypothetical protein CYK37_08125 [Mesorhizobium loti]
MAERERARRLSRRLEFLITAIVVVILGLVGIGLAWAFAQPDKLGSFAAQQYGFAAPAQSSAIAALLLVVVFLVQTAPMIAGLLSLRLAFRDIAQRETIGAGAARWLRRSGIAFFVNALVMLLSRPVVSLILSIDMPPGQRFLSIGFGTPELLTLLVSGVLVMFGHLMTVAAEIEDENKRFI